MQARHPQKTPEKAHPGVSQHKFVVVIHNFSDQPPGKEFRSVVQDNSTVLGFKGQGSKFWVAVQPRGSGLLKQRGKAEGEMEVFLYFQSDYDIKMHVDWSASITDPSGKALATSTVPSDVLEKKNGEYKRSQYRHIADGTSVRIMDDVQFGLHKNIKLFDGALHVVVDVRFKVLEGGHPLIIASYDAFVAAYRDQRHNKDFYDFDLISADGERIKTWRVFLAHLSPVFNAIFNNGGEEAHTKICRIEDASSTSVEAMQAFLLGDEPNEWSFDLAQDLFKLACRYQLPAMRNRSAIELGKALTTRNVVEVLLLAYGHSERVLMNEAFHFLEDNYRAASGGLFDRIERKDIPEALLREWRMHWSRRLGRIDMN